MCAGTNSYTVFTLDKLIYKLVKQASALLNDETALKLLELYKYEKSRRAPVVDATYYQNAHLILHEDMTFRFESKQNGDFCMQLLDTDRTEVLPGVPFFPQDAAHGEDLVFSHWHASTPSCEEPAQHQISHLTAGRAMRWIRWLMPEDHWTRMPITLFLFNHGYKYLLIKELSTFMTECLIP